MHCRLPAGLVAESVRSFVTGDGVLTIEAMLPSIAPPADVTIPVQAGSLLCIFLKSVQMFEKS